MLNLILKWSEDLNGHFLKRFTDLQIANRHMKRWSTSLVSGETQNPNEISPYTHQMASSKRPQITKVSKMQRK